MGPIIIDLQGTELSAEERELLQHPLVAGIILFARNAVSSEQITELCQSVRAARQAPLLIAVDQEGGRIQRLKEGYLRLPSMGEIGNVYHKSEHKGLAYAHSSGWLMAAEILASGIDISFAPVLDLNKQLNTVIGDRAFHSDPIIVAALAKSFIQGMREAGMAATGKHFPGHGSVTADSHHDLPQDHRQFDDIYADDIQPFIKLIQADIAAIMPAHILFSAMDNKPVGFSSYWLKDILRKQLQFKGVIISDALDMQGAVIAGNFADRAVAALDAGCDIAMTCNNRAGAIQILDQLPKHYTLSDEKFNSLRGKFSHSLTSLHASTAWQTQYHSFMEYRKIYENHE